MSFMHKMAFNIMKKGKMEYDPKNPPDYLLRREAEQKRVKAVAKSIQFKHINEDGVIGEYLSDPKNPTDRIVFYIHGGGFVAGSAESRRDIASWIVKKFKYNVFNINYRLAPEFPFPSGAEDCLKGYEMLLESYDAEKICIMGESAGGNLVLSTVLQAQVKNLPLPACVVSISPVVQFDKELPSYSENVDTDCMLSKTFTQEVRDTYLQSEDNWKNPFAAPLYGNLSKFPPTYLVASDSEYLRDDTMCFYEKLLEATRTCKIDIYHELMHAFVIIPSFPESKKALKKIKQFIDEYIG